MLHMTGDQGAVLVCAQEQERFCHPPPPPLPKTKLTLFRVQCSRVQCFRWEAIKVQCLCAHRNRNAFVTPRQPCPRLSWLCSGRNARGCNASDDRPSRCSADDRRWVSDWLVCGWGLCVCVCMSESILCAQLSWICVRRWVGSVCAAELDLCAWLSWICVRGRVLTVCAAELDLCAPLSRLPFVVYKNVENQ